MQNQSTTLYQNEQPAAEALQDVSSLEGTASDWNTELGSRDTSQRMADFEWETYDEYTHYAVSQPEEFELGDSYFFMYDI